MVILLACDQPEEAAAPAQLGAEQIYTRASLDLRGVRPSVAELDRLAADPDALPDALDTLVQDERVETRVMEMWAEPFRTRIDSFLVSGVTYGRDEYLWAAAVGEEPLRIVAHVVASDLPYTDIVTADWTMVNEELAVAWPTDYPTGGQGWRQAHYTDGRPSAGVLSTNGLWWRYTSTDENFNRGRANAASRILLCNDFLVRPVNFSRTAATTDAADLLQQTQTDPNCTTCHVALDPLAAYLGGFTWFSDDFVSPHYNIAAEQRWQQTTGTAPGYFGTPGTDLADLGRQVAADPRFVSCAVETAYQGILGREATVDDTDALLALREVLLASDLRMRPVLRAILDDVHYRAADDETVGGVPKKLLSVEQLASSVEALTGYRWAQWGYDMMGTDDYGLRVLGGGMDGVRVTHPVDQPNPTVVLVQQRLAELGAAWAVDERAPLLTIDPSDAGLSQSVRRAELVALTRKVLGQTRSEKSQEILELDSLWIEVSATEGPEVAWTAVLTTLLRDPDFLLY